MSKIIAIMPCRNSAWVLGLSARALLMWVDELHILCHACADRTYAIVCELEIEYGKRVVDLRIDSGIWQEMAHRQLLLESARGSGATHIVTIDDDEVLTGNLLPAIRGWVEGVRPGAIMQLPWLQLRDSINLVITSGMWAQQSASVAFQDDPDWHWAAVAGYDHHHRHPMGKPYVPVSPLAPMNRTGGLMHLQMVSERRLKWKQYWYKLTERIRWPVKTPAQLNAQYDPTVCPYVCMEPDPPNQDGWAGAPWWDAYEDLMQHLDVDAEPWQRAEVLRILRENPGIEAGLTTYGLEC